jgi:hypothetical protein
MLRTRRKQQIPPGQYITGSAATNLMVLAAA